MLIVSPQADSKEIPKKLDPFSQFKVARETRSELCRTALWECFWDIIASFILHFHIDHNAPRLPPKNNYCLRFLLGRP